MGEDDRPNPKAPVMHGTTQRQARLFRAVNRQRSKHRNDGRHRPGRSDEQLHTVYQWNDLSGRGHISHGGWGGQGLIIYPELDVVAVYTSYFKDDNHAEVPLGPVVHDVLAGVFVSPE